MIANIATDEMIFPRLIASKRQELQEFLSYLVRSLEMLSLVEHEEYILNSMSCLTNVLFYDTPQQEAGNELVQPKMRA